MAESTNTQSTAEQEIHPDNEYSHKSLSAYSARPAPTITEYRKSPCVRSLEGLAK